MQILFLPAKLFGLFSVMPMEIKQALLAIKMLPPGWWDSGVASFHKLKGCGFDPPSGRTPRLQFDLWSSARQPVDVFLSHRSVSLSLKLINTSSGKDFKKTFLMFPSYLPSGSDVVPRALLSL